jgi:hypothetical protein
MVAYSRLLLAFDSREVDKIKRGLSDFLPERPLLLFPG